MVFVQYAKLSLGKLAYFTKCAEQGLKVILSSSPHLSRGTEPPCFHFKMVWTHTCQFFLWSTVEISYRQCLQGSSCTSGTLCMSKIARWCYLRTVDSLGARRDGHTAFSCERGIVCLLPPALLRALPNEPYDLLFFFPHYAVLPYLFLCCSLLEVCFNSMNLSWKKCFWREVIKICLYTSLFVFVCTHVQRPG